jgi:hemolysin activation/secretion protein
VQAFTLSVDDTGNAQTTRTRLSAAYHHADVSGRDDQLAVQVQVSPERLAAVRVFSLSYRLPLYGAGLMAHAYTSYSNVVSAATATAVGELNFSGNGRVTGFELTRFIERAGDFEQRLTAGLDQRDYLNSCAIQGLPEGACGSAGASVSTHPLTVGYQALRKGGRPAGVGVTLASNLALGGANGGAADFEAVRPGATRHFQALRLQAFLSLPLADNWQMNFRGAAQAASAPLVPGEQFGLTGVNIVRGYEEREVTGDSGFAASFEALLPPMLSLAPGDIPTGLHGLRLLAFVDAGVTRNRNDQTCDGADRRCRLSSLGIGARFSVGTSSWRIDLARANDTARLTNRGDVRLHFSARMAFP